MPLYGESDRYRCDSGDAVHFVKQVLLRRTVMSETANFCPLSQPPVLVFLSDTMNPNSTRQSDIKKWVKAQADKLDKAARGQSFERHVEKCPLIFTAVFCYESGTQLANVQPHKLRNRIDQEVDEVKGVTSRASALPLGRRIAVMKKAVQLGKAFVAGQSEAVNTVTCIEECQTVDEAGNYVGAIKNIYFELKPERRDPDFEVILELETAIWKYWIIYDACLRLAKKPVASVTASNVLEKCVEALESLKKQVNSGNDITRSSVQGLPSEGGRENDTTLLLRPCVSDQPTSNKKGVASSGTEDGTDTGCVSECKESSSWKDWVYSFFNGTQADAAPASQELSAEQGDALKKTILFLNDEVEKSKKEIQLLKEKLRRTEDEPDKAVKGVAEKEPQPALVVSQDNSSRSASCKTKDAETRSDQSKQPEGEASTPDAVKRPSGHTFSKVDVPAPLTFEVEEISDPRRPSEIAKRFQDLFNYSYDVGESLDTTAEKSNQKLISNFIIDMLTAVHRAATLTLEEKGKLLARALDLESHVDRPTAQKAVIESAVSLCRVMPASLTSTIYESVTTKAIEFQNWRKKADVVPACVYTTANVFLEKCIPVFWDIVLQRRPLVLVTDHKTFRPSQHERFYESDESNQIDYFVWPCLMEEATRKVLAKGRVVTKAKELTKPKDEAEPSKESDSAKPPFDSPV